MEMENTVLSNKAQYADSFVCTERTWRTQANRILTFMEDKLWKEQIASN